MGVQPGHKALRRRSEGRRLGRDLEKARRRVRGLGGVGRKDTVWESLRGQEFVSCILQRGHGMADTILDRSLLEFVLPPSLDLSAPVSIKMSMKPGAEFVAPKKREARATTEMHAGAHHRL